MTDWLELRGTATTGAQTFAAPLPTMPPFFPKEVGGLHPSCLFTQAQLGETEPSGSQEFPWLPFREISAPQALLWPWPFPEDNSLHARENSIAQGSSLQGVAGASG